MLIVDAQVHIWSAGPPTNQAHRQVNSYSAEECIRDMDAAGVDACLLHPPGWDPNSGKISEEAAGPTMPEPICDPRQFSARQAGEPVADRRLEAPARHARFALCLYPAPASGELDDRRHDGLAVAGGRKGQEFQIALMAFNYLPQVAQIAERHPGLRLLLDHYARVRDGKDDAAHGNQAALLALAKFANVAVKATGAPGNSSHPYPYRNIHKYTQQIVEAFGPQRTFWGTDITRMPCSWKQCVTMFTEEMSFLKGHDLDLVMGQAHVRLDRLEPARLKSPRPGSASRRILAKSHVGAVPGWRRSGHLETGRIR